MIRIDNGDSWLLLGHADHAALAGEFARHWKNEMFLPAEPFAHVLDAVSRHDDSWKAVDALPSLTPDGNPSAFSHELVGSYDAFEEIDLRDYLEVRRRATEEGASRDPYAAILISMHTVNLLTEQADLSTLSEEDAAFHSEFIEGQMLRQKELIEGLRASGFPEAHLEENTFRRGFEFLQACDSLSLLVGVDYPTDSALRHEQVMRDGQRVTIAFHPKGDGLFELDPYPFDEDNLECFIPYRLVAKSDTSSQEAFRSAYANAPIQSKRIQFSAKTSS